MSNDNPEIAIRRCFEATEKEYKDAIVERDTYRELCGDLLDEVKEFYSRASGRSKGVEMLITKAESILGDKNGR